MCRLLKEHSQLADLDPKVWVDSGHHDDGQNRMLKEVRVSFEACECIRHDLVEISVVKRKTNAFHWNPQPYSCFSFIPCLADILSWRAGHSLKLNPREIELQFIPDDLQELMLSLDNSLISPSHAPSHLQTAINCPFSHTLLIWHGHVTFSFAMLEEIVHSGACSVSCHPETGPLQLILAALPLTISTFQLVQNIAVWPCYAPSTGFQ